jgi:hypothetical protein
MNLSRSDFPSRIGVRAVGAGLLVTFSITLLSLLLAGGMGIWRLDMYEVPRLGPAFWLWSFLSWGLSVYAGGYVAALVSRSNTQLDGAIHGLLVWAASCFVGSLLLLVAAGSQLSGIPEKFTAPILWGFFVADLTALAMGIFGGTAGATSESRIEILENTKPAPAKGPRLDQPVPMGPSSGKQ